MSINLELLDLRAFLAIFDTFSFRKAADLLNLSQPALSRRVQRLETRLGSTLFERSTRRVEATFAGQKFEPLARRLVEEFDASVTSMNDVNQQRRNQVTIASIPTAATYFLPRAMQRFDKAYPGVRLRVLECMPREGLRSVLNGEADLGINLIGATEEEINYSHLLDDPYVFVCHREHPLARRRTIRWSDLSDHPLIRIGEAPAGAALSGRADGSLNRALLDNALSKMNIRLSWVYEAYYLTTVLSMVETGLGASVVPRLATPRNAHPVLVTRPIRPHEVTRAIGIVERRRTSLSPAAKCLRDILLGDSRTSDVARQRPPAARSRH